MTRARTLLLLALCGVPLLWLWGPPGRLGVVLAVLLLAPGYLLERALRPGASGLFVRPSLWLALSLSAIPLLYQWTTALGLVLPTSALAVLASCAALVAVVLAWRELGEGDRRFAFERNLRSHEGSSTERAQHMSFVPPPLAECALARGEGPRAGYSSYVWWLALLAVFGLTLWLRFENIRDLPLPNWGDSVHHGLLVRIAAERGQAPYSLYPYLPIERLPYHWGYHVVTAAAMQLSGLELPEAMLWSGQVLNALHALAAAALASSLWRRPLSGVIAGLVVGLLSIFPAYYVSWGRYTQLTGLLIIPALAIAWHAGLRRPRLGGAAAVAVLLAGLSLIHFRVLLFALAYMLAAWIAWAAPRPGAVVGSLSRAAAAALLAAALAGPWLLLLADRSARPAVERPDLLLGGEGTNTLDPATLWAGQNRILIALALLAAGWLLLRRRPAAATLVSWVGLLALMANPWLLGYMLPAAGAALALRGALERRWLLALLGAPLLLSNPWLVRIPYLWLITNDVVVISLFLPVAVLLGGGAAELWEVLERRATGDGRRTTSAPSPRERWPVVGGRLVLALAVVVLALWGAGSNRSVVNPQTILAAEADRLAIRWVAANTASDARFLINAARWFPNADRGTDGGWWLLPLTGRWTSTPPALFIYGDALYVAAALADSRTVADFRPGQEQRIFDLIARAGVDYVYIGPRGGPLTPALFAEHPSFAKVYDDGNVTIFQVMSPSVGAGESRRVTVPE